MMQGAGPEYGAVGQEDSQLMQTAVAGAAMETAKREVVKFKNMVFHLREGPLSIKILSYIAGVLLVVDGFFSFFGKFFTLHPVDAVVHFYMFIFGWVIILLEARIALLPTRILAGIHKYCAFVTVVWGRGYFFIFVGTLSLAQWEFMDIIIGFYMVLLGAGMIYWGQEAYAGLDALMAEMKDPAVVKTMFDKFDHNDDGLLSTKELGNLLKSLGAELRPTEIEAACIIIDSDNDGKISLSEFQAWWARHDVPAIV